MAITDYTIVETKNGFRIHRATCKRASAASPLKDAIAFAPGNVLSATLASCCKPKGAKVYIDAIELEADKKIHDLFEALTEIHNTKPATGAAETLAKVTGSRSVTLIHDHRDADGNLVVDSVEEYVAPTTDVEVRREEPSPMTDEEVIAKFGPDVLADETPAEAEAFAESFDYSGISLHYHAALRQTGATRDEGLAAFAALKKWRRADADYKALPPQDTKWATSERYAWERDFLIGYMAGVAGMGDEGEQTYASVQTPAHQGTMAWLADFAAEVVL